MNEIYIYFVDSMFDFVNIRNNIAFLFIISRYYRIGSVIEYKIKKSYSINMENYFLTIKILSDKKFKIAEFTILLIFKSIINKIIIDFCLEIKFFNKIIIYGKLEYIEIMRRISEKNPRV